MSDETVSVLADRYITESAAARGFPEFTMDELDSIREFIEARFTDEEQHILYAYRNIEREFTRGHRCAVCGRTEKQSKAINYDCAREC